MEVEQFGGEGRGRGREGGRCKNGGQEKVEEWWREGQEKGKGVGEG